METCACEGAEGEEDVQPCDLTACHNHTRRHCSSTPQPGCTKSGESSPCSHHISLSPPFILHLGICPDGYQETRKYHTFLLPLSNWHIPSPATHAWESPQLPQEVSVGLGSSHHLSVMIGSTGVTKQPPRTQQPPSKLISGCHTNQVQLRELTCR